MNIIDRQAKINLNSTPVGYEFIHEGKDYKFPTLEKVHEFFFTETKLDTVKLSHQDKKSYVHFSIDEIETFTSKKALRRTLSQESNGAWIEKREGKKKYFVDEGWLFSSIKKISKEEYQNRPEKGLTFQKVLGVALGIFAIAPAAIEIARNGPVGTNEIAMGLIALQQKSPLLAVVGYSLVNPLVHAQVPAFGEFMINTNTSYEQYSPAIAELEDGGFIVAWQSFQSEVDYDIYAQRYNSSGFPVRSEFRVHTNILTGQTHPALAGLNGGGFVAVWASSHNGDSDVFGQVYDINDLPLGTEFRVNTVTTNGQSGPEVAKLANGDFVVVWNSMQSGVDEDVYGQRFDSNRMPVGSEFRANTVVTNVQQTPSITGLPNGGFVIAWHSLQDGINYDVYARWYDASGTPLSSEFLVNTNTTGGQINPACATLSDGSVIVVYIGTQSGNLNIYGQRYDSSSTPVGTEFLVNTNTTGSQQNPTVTRFMGNGFVVAWFGYQTGNADIYGQKFNATAFKLGPEFRINTNTTSDQDTPRLARTLDDGFVVVWQSTQNGGYVNSYQNYDVFGQRFDLNGTSIPRLIAPSSVAPSTSTSSFSALLTSPSSTSFQNNYSGSSITAIASSILSTPSRTSSTQIGSSSTSFQQTPTILPPESSQTPIATIPSTPSQLSQSINTPSQTASPVPPFSTPTIFFTPTPNSLSSNPSKTPSAVPTQPSMSVPSDISSEEKCGQDCVSSYTNLVGGVLGGVASVVTIALGVFAVYKCRKSKAKEKDIELQTPQRMMPPRWISPEDIRYPTLENSRYVLSPKEVELFITANLQEDQAQYLAQKADHSSSSSESDHGSRQPIRVQREIIHGRNHRYEIIPVITALEARELADQTGYQVSFEGQGQVQKIKLGSGHFGEVRIAKIQGEERFVAVKEVPNTNQNRREGKYHLRLKEGPNILPIYDTFKIENVYYHFMLLVGFGDGHTLKNKLIRLDEQERETVLMKTALGIATGLMYMHRDHIYHFDLKPDNILFDQRGEVYISDFGCARKKQDGQSYETYGDLRYASPEAKKLYDRYQKGGRRPPQPIDAAAQDAWGLGMILADMLGLPIEQPLAAIFEEDNPHEGELKYLLWGLLQPNPEHRWTIQNAFEYLNKYVNLEEDARQDIFNRLA